jgi:zinc protease
MMTWRTTRRLALVALLLGTIAPSIGAKTPLPPIERITLPNGLTVLLLADSANPFVDLRFVVKAGSASDPAGQEGLADLTASMLTNGTTTRTEDELAQALDDMGAYLSASASLDGLMLSGSVVTLDPTHLDTFLGVFHDCLRDATFPEESLTKTRKLTAASIRRMADQHSQLASEAFRAALYGNGPRGRLATLDSLSGITRDDLVAFRDRVVIPQHAILAIAGDFNLETMMAWIRTHLADPNWGRGVCRPSDVQGTCGRLCKGEACLDNPMASSRYRDAPEAPTVLLVDRADPSINQVQWRMGMDSPVVLTDPQWAAFRVGAQVLGGDFTSRLNTTLRVKEGLTYGARFHVGYGARDSGAMRVSTYVAPKDLAKALELSIAEIKGVTEAPLEASDIANFKDKIINAFPFRFETVSDTLGEYLSLAAEGVNVAWLEDYTDTIATPSAADIHAAVQSIKPEAMTLVAVGNRDLIETLSLYGRVRVVTADDFLTSGLSKAVWADEAHKGSQP